MFHMCPPTTPAVWLRSAHLAREGGMRREVEGVFVSGKTTGLERGAVSCLFDLKTRARLRRGSLLQNLNTSSCDCVPSPRCSTSEKKKGWQRRRELFSGEDLTWNKHKSEREVKNPARRAGSFYFRRRVAVGVTARGGAADKASEEQNRKTKCWTKQKNTSVWPLEGL